MQEIPDITPFRRRYEEIDAEMTRPDFYQDGRRAARLAREHRKLGQLLQSFNELEKIRGEIAGHEALAEDARSGSDLQNLAREELPGLREKYDKFRRETLLAMIPPDPGSSRNTVIEIRAGTGGEEAALFAGDLYRMYCRFAEQKGWRAETLGGSPSEAGGYKEIAFIVRGDDVYKMLKFESGVHRVQRVPVTEAGGRVHTSAATVAVLPEAEEVEAAVAPEDLEISVARASGPGGQGVNTTDSAVQIMHKPTGLIVRCADERSQLKNKNKAMTVLRARLLEQKRREEEAKYAARRKNQVGSGDRSERIRTYNFPQNRLTDHRIGLTLYNLPEIMEGNLGSVVEALRQAGQEEEIKNLLKADDLEN